MRGSAGAVGRGRGRLAPRLPQQCLFSAVVVSASLDVRWVVHLYVFTQIFFKILGEYKSEMENVLECLRAIKEFSL